MVAELPALTSFHGIGPTLQPNGEVDRQTLRKTAEDFESLFLNIVLKSMRNTVPKEGLISGGNAEEVYRSMLDDEYSKLMASQRHTGLADHIEKFLLDAYGNSQQNAGKKAYGVLQTQAKQETIGTGRSIAPPK